MSSVQVLATIERVRILHFLPWLAGGGVEVAFRELIRALPAEQYEHRVACIETRGPRKNDFEAMNVPLTVLGGRASIHNVGALARLTALARAWKPHVIHAGVFEGQVFGTIAGRLARVPVVMTEENNCPVPPRERSRLTRFLLRSVLMQNDAVIAVAPAVGRYLVEKNGVPQRLVHVIPHGVRRPVRPPPAELAMERSRLGLPNGALVLGTVCRVFDFHKKVSDLIQTLSILRDRLPELHLLVVGDGPDRAALTELSRSLGLESRVHWAGYQRDPACCFHLMDIFALVSAFEGFGIVFIEAAFCELPCIGTSVGGIVDAVEDGVTGLLVSPGNIEQLSAAVVRLADSRELRHEMGRAGRLRAERIHSVERYADGFHRLFVEALAARGIRVKQRHVDTAVAP